jgi:uracil-DNA glycosylase
MRNIIAGRPESAAKGIGYWSDAFPYYNAKLMIVGQDWGNEKYVTKFGKFPSFYKEYTEQGNPTWENLMKYLVGAEFDLHGGDIYLTNALLCARTGEMTGNSAIDKASFAKCFNYLKEQVDIIKPVVIAALGQLVFDVLNENLDIRYRYKKFADIVAMVKSNPEAFKTKDNVTLYPLYHTGAYGSMNREKAGVDGDMLDDFISLRKVVYNCKL